jgi:hypothetical protein
MANSMPNHAEEAAHHARVLLDEAASALQARLDRSTARMEEMAANVEPLPEEQVDKIREMYLTGPCAAEWNGVAEKVRRGELTWREVAEGQAFADPDVAAALHASFQHAREHPPEPPEPMNHAERSRPAANDYDDDPDYFAGGDFLRG